MLSIHDAAGSNGTFARREVLQVGGLGALGVSLPTLLATKHVEAGPKSPAAGLSNDLGTTFGRAKNVIFLWLQGGPPQHETFDPKPQAPLEIRGPFKPIQTNVEGIQFCELLPRTARCADRMAIVRSISTRDDNHDVSGYWLLTGYPYGPGSARQIKPTDWPYFGSVIKLLKPSERLPALTSVWIPDMMRLNDNVTPAGQTAGFLGKLWEPERFVGDPALANYEIEGLSLLQGVGSIRMDRRRNMVQQLDQALDGIVRSTSIESWDRLSQQAFDLVTSGAARAAFDLSQESDAVRDRYGRYTWGQSVLLARRLIEAGVRLVHVNWARDPGDNAVDNPLWDTHALNADRLQDNLCPQFDPTFAALMDDLTERGLIDETLVVVIGEFGRTPKINSNGGRDHWGHVFSCAFAGAGIRGGQVVGASDKNGAYPATTPITGGDLTATIYHLLGIAPQGVFHDRENRPHSLTKGEPIADVLGESLSPNTLRIPEGDIALVPPFDTRLLYDTDFQSDAELISVMTPSREKGWRGWPLTGEKSAICVEKRNAQVVVGLTQQSEGAPSYVEQGERALLAQEIRSARGGQYTFRVSATAFASADVELEQTFSAHFRCRLVLFRFLNLQKDPRAIEELASVEFRPLFNKTQEFVLRRFLGSTIPGTNFSIGCGLGVMITLERTTTDRLMLPAIAQSEIALQIVSVQLEFEPRQRDDNVTV